MTTPHPTDALPLPEPFAALSDDETPALYKRWADQIRAAHRDGYELAMGKLANQTCVHSRSGGMMHKELIANLKDWASDADAHRKQMVPVHRDTLRRIAAALAAPAQEQAGAASASLLADALRKLLARTSGEHYPVEQELARTALSSHDDAFRQECDDADELLRLLGLDPESCRTDGGFINMPRVRSLLIDRNPYGALSELLECFDLPYPPETAGSDAQSAWGDRRAAAKEQARAILALKAAGAAEVSDEHHGLDTAERVCFYEQDFYVLSNFSSFRVTFDGQTFDTSEAAYHYQRFTSAEDRHGVMYAYSAHDAFRYAQDHKANQLPDWDAVKVGVMRDILRAKAQQHEYVRRKLLATGDRELVENSWRDDFWGWGPNRDGQNMLGKLWMEIRAELRALKAGGED